MTGPGRELRRCTLLAVAAYLAVALWAYRGMLNDPTGTLLTTVSQGPMASICRWDQSIAVATATRHARVLLSEPWKLLDGFQCFPLARSHTLGEHMFGLGLLGAVPLLLTGDPIATYNAILVLSVWIAGISMYAFSRHYLRDPAAAFVAGLLFALSMPRVFDAAHPFAYADLWTPLAMLFLHRLFAVGGLRNALGFALFAGLLVFQSLYPLVSGSILLAFYSVHLAWVYRRQLVARIPAFLVALAALAVTCVLVLGPYLETRATWGLLANRGSIPQGLPGLLSLSAGNVLTALAMLDRMRRRRDQAGSDPRLCFFLAAIFLLWFGVFPIPIPGTDFVVRSPLRLIRAVIPGGDAVRGLGGIAMAVELPVAFLAGYGVHAVLGLLPRRGVVLATAAIALYVAAERVYPPLAVRVRGVDLTLEPWFPRPEKEDVELLRSTSGPILDLPHAPIKNMKSWLQADYLRLASYDSRQSSSCYGSYPSPLDRYLVGLARALPEPSAADALHALGFRTVLLHLDSFWPPNLKRFAQTLQGNRGSRDRLEEVGRSEHLIAYRLKSPVAVSSDLRLLSAPARTDAIFRPSPAAKSIEVPIANAGFRTFLHPPPIEPTEVLIRWSDASGTMVAEKRARVLLPLALGLGARETLELPNEIPVPAGSYQLTVAPLAEPDLVIGRVAVEVDVDSSASSSSVSTR